MVLNFFVPLLGKFFLSDFLEIWFYPMIAICFIATVPSLVHFIFRRK